MLSKVISALCLMLWVSQCTVSAAEDPNLTKALKLMSETPLIDGWVERSLALKKKKSALNNGLNYFICCLSVLMRTSSSKHDGLCGKKTHFWKSFLAVFLAVKCCKITVNDQRGWVCDLLLPALSATTTYPGNFESNSTISSMQWTLTHLPQRTLTSRRSSRENWGLRYKQNRMYWGRDKSEKKSLNEKKQCGRNAWNY